MKTSAQRSVASGMIDPKSILARLGPQGVLAIVAVAALAAVAASLGERLHLPWDGIVPFLAIAAILFASSFAADLVARRRPTTRALALWTPFAVVYLCYRALRGAIPLWVGAGFEPQLVRADEAIFGISPAWWFERIATPWLTELLSYAYATMFFLPLAVLLVLYARRRDRALAHVALSLQLAFYLGFTIFLLVPARSPDVVYSFATALHGHGFYEASSSAWRQLQAVTFDAFPSMHTAISTLALVHAIRLRRELPRLMPAILAPIVILLQIATLYLRQHYFVDLIAGWAVAATAIALAHVIASAWPKAGPGSSPVQIPRASSQASNSGVGLL